MVDDERRVDLFLSFHGSERLSCGLTTRQLMRRVVEELERRGGERGARPAVFFDEVDVRGHVPSDIFTAVLQLRGGGFGLCLLTPAFFDFPWCVAELAALLRVHQETQYAIRLRCMSLDCTPSDVLYHEHVRHFVDELRAHSVLPSVSLLTPLRAVSAICDFVFRVWDGADGVADRWPAILGATRSLSMQHLQSFFLLPNSQLSLRDKEKALISYHVKWERSKSFPWDSAQLQTFYDMFQYIRQEFLDIYKAHNIYEGMQFDQADEADADKTDRDEVPPQDRPLLRSDSPTTSERMQIADTGGSQPTEHQVRSDAETNHVAR